MGAPRLQAMQRVCLERGRFECLKFSFMHPLRLWHNSFAFTVTGGFSLGNAWSFILFLLVRRP